ncbi:MAG: hypothetical protein LBB75_05540 [Oscillospiraceae bacterium]|jgi:hypothetical protein|nr:hypothetical protein [Oscillospiraceae bacterium]
MEQLRTWALSVAMAALAGGLVWLLAPKGSVQKALRTLIGVFLLCAFLSPFFTRADIALDWILPETQSAPVLPALEDTLARQLKTAVEEEIGGRIDAVLNERAITGQISLDTSIWPDGSIEIVTARVLVPPGTDTRGLAAALKAQAGLDVEIVVGEQSDGQR